jgi:hypothetical protein
MRDDAILLTNELLDALTEDGIFNTGNPYLERDYLFNELQPIIERNLINLGEFYISDGDFDLAIGRSILKSKQDSLDSLIDKGLVVIKGMDTNNDFLLGLNDKIKNS